jgi:hypothetical protein
MTPDRTVAIVKKGASVLVIEQKTEKEIKRIRESAYPYFVNETEHITLNKNTRILNFRILKGFGAESFYWSSRDSRGRRTLRVTLSENVVFMDPLI